MTQQMYGFLFQAALPRPQRWGDSSEVECLPFTLQVQGFNPLLGLQKKKEKKSRFTCQNALHKSNCSGWDATKPGLDGTLR